MTDSFSITDAIIVAIAITLLLGLARWMVKKKGSRGEALTMEKKLVSVNEMMKGIGA